MKTFTRILLEEKLEQNVSIVLTAKTKLHHLSAVLRIKPNEEVRVFNANDGEWLAQIKEISHKRAVLEVKSKIREPEEYPISITVAPALIKHHRLGILIEKCTELGAMVFSPLITERTTAPKLKLDKLQAYVVGAVEQSTRISVPAIHEAAPLARFLEENKHKTILTCHFQAQPIMQVLSNMDKLKGLIILTGPEGGFSKKEIELMESYKNIINASLGNNVLRAETAAICALSCTINFFADIAA